MPCVSVSLEISVFLMHSYILVSSFLSYSFFSTLSLSLSLSLDLSLSVSICRSLSEHARQAIKVHPLTHHSLQGKFHDSQVLSFSEIYISMFHDII